MAVTLAAGIGLSADRVARAALFAAAAWVLAYMLAYRWVPSAITRTLVFEWRRSRRREEQMPGEAAIRESRRRAKSAGTEGARRGRTTPQGAGTLVVRLKRAYDPPAPGDGGRVLVDRVWPRGVSKEKIRVDAWLPNLGPTAPLRKWFGHDPAKWDAFRRRYRQELAKKRDLLQELVGHAKAGRLTLVYGARDPAHNQAVVIKEVLEGSAGGQRSPTTGPGAC